MIYKEIIINPIQQPLLILIQIYVFQHALLVGLEIILHFRVFNFAHLILLLIIRQEDVWQNALAQRGFMMILQHGNVFHNALKALLGIIKIGLVFIPVLHKYLVISSILITCALKNVLNRILRWYR